VTRPILDWETLTVGEEFGPFRYEVSAERVAAYRSVTGDDSVEVVDGEAVAPPTILTFPMLLMVDYKYTPRPGCIHARQVFELLAPVRVGATLTVTGVLTEMRLKRGRKYFTVESTAADERGRTIARGETVGLYPSIDLREEAAVTNASDDLIPVSLLVDGDVVYRYRMVGGDVNPIHLDDDAARALGLPKAIAHGMIGGALLSRLLAENLGEGWMRRGMLDIKFVRPTFIGETLTARGSVRSRTPLCLDVVVENDDGRPVIIGEACRPTDEEG